VCLNPFVTFGYSEPLSRERHGTHCHRGVALHRYVGVEGGNRMHPRLTAEGSEKIPEHATPISPPPVSIHLFESLIIKYIFLFH
jgi:hypothetical protein